MTAKSVMMTGLAFTIGVFVGVCLHLPEVISPSTYTTADMQRRHGSPRTLPAWQEGLSPADSELVGNANEPYSPNTGRKRDGSGVIRSSGIARIVPEPNRMPQSQGEWVNKDYNDMGFIHSRNNPGINISELSDSAIIAHPQRHRGLALLKSHDATTTKGENENVESKILSVLRDIRVVQLERNHVLDNIARQRIKSGLQLAHSGDGTEQRSWKYDNVGRRKLQDESSNISDENLDSGTPIANSLANNTASQYVLGIGSKGARPTDHQTESRVHPSVDRRDKPVDIVDGVFWSQELETLCPTGFQERVYTEWSERISQTNVVGVAEGCGRMQNRRLTFQDSSSACARYRPNTDQIQGEIYSYYLSRLLNISNVPPSVLLPVKYSDRVWARVRRELAMSQWGDDRMVVLTKWIDSLEPVYIPTELKGQHKRLYPDNVQLLNKSLSELCELVQWSDLIVFDYLTANLDRIVNNMFNQQWNSQMMSYPAHNLHKVKDTNVLVFLDNESGLFHGYRLLDKYSKYHEELLSAMCVFRKETVREIERLFLENNLEQELYNLLNSNESQAINLPQMPEKNMNILKERLQDVFEQIQKCRRLFSR